MTLATIAMALIATMIFTKKFDDIAFFSEPPHPSYSARSFFLISLLIPEGSFFGGAGSSAFGAEACE